MSVDEDMSLFFYESTPVYLIDDINKRGEEAYFPKPGFACKVKWSSAKYSEDWRKDNYL